LNELLVSIGASTDDFDKAIDTASRTADALVRNLDAEVSNQRTAVLREHDVLGLNVVGGSLAPAGVRELADAIVR
jgi:hypothetical protein